MSTNTVEKRLLTEHEACTFLGMSRPFLARARCERRTNAPAYVKIGRSIRYDVKTLEAFIAANRHGVDTESN